MIWKHATKIVEAEDGKTSEIGRMFMKQAAFFKPSQVERIKA